MPRNTQEYVSFVANHFRPLEAMCRNHARFASDDQLIAFLRPFGDEDKNLSRLIGRMREVGILVELAGTWTLPPFLVEFIEKLTERHALASPKVILGWVETLAQHVKQLSLQIEAASIDFGMLDLDAVNFLLGEVADVLRTIVRTVQDNCERIASEVSEYRRVEDSAQLRRRLSRLIHLHDAYLEPVIRIVDVTGDLHAVTQEISNCCVRLAGLDAHNSNGIADEARFIHKDVMWLRRVVVRRADEARRELAPLCEAAARESKISRGVNRALDAIQAGQWDRLDLENKLHIVVEQDVAMFSDLALERYLRMALKAKSRKPPRVPATVPSALSIPITPEELIDKLELMDSVADVLGWILDTSEEMELGAAVRLFHTVVERRSDRALHTEVRCDYQRADLVVNATRWIWKGQNDGQSDDNPANGSSPRKSRGRVPVP